MIVGVWLATLVLGSALGSAGVQAEPAQAATGPVAAGPGSAGLQAPVPLAPSEAIQISGAGKVAPIPFVWLAPAQPAAVRFYLEVADLSDHQPREVFMGYVFGSETLVPLAPAAGAYAWRVFAVSATMQQYAASPWATFRTVEGRAADGQRDNGRSE